MAKDFIMLLRIVCNLKHKFFISGTFYLIFSDHCWPWVTEPSVLLYLIIYLVGYLACGLSDDRDSVLLSDDRDFVSLIVVI